MSWVIYQCSCGNYIAAPTIAAAMQKNVAKDVRIEGMVLCTAAAHGMAQPEMRKTIVAEVAE